MSSTKFKYKFSFVIPIYNVEDYLAETVESILAQTMDFEQNCEIIFVNDGSPDNSEEVCLRYRAQFPNNVKYIKQENGGLSAARNAGIKAVRGKYVSFIDPDDKLSPDTLDKVYGFFEANYDRIDVASIKIQMFEARTDEHILNYRFDVSKVIDIQRDFTQIQLHAASAFVKAEALEHHQFDARIRKFAEDLKFITELVLDKMAYGVVSEATYLYRKREAGGSIMDSERSSKVWYTEIPKLVHMSLIEYSNAKLGYVPKYVQHVIMHDIQWRFRQPRQYSLDDLEVKQYKKMLTDIVKQIDDDVIIAQKHMVNEFKFFALSMKYPDKPVLPNAIRKGLKYYYRGLEVYDADTVNPIVHIDLVSASKDTVIIEGYFNGFLFADTIMKFKVGNEWREVEHVKRPSTCVYYFDELVYDRNAFKVELPLQPAKNIAACLVAGEDVKALRLLPHRQARFSSGSSHSYRVFNHCVIVLGRYEMFVQKKTLLRILVKEARRQKEIVARGRYRNALLRLAGIVIKSSYRKKVWLITDRPTVAGDNAEALFRYPPLQHNPGIKPYFILSPDSKDYDRLRSVGRVIKPNSLYHKLLFMGADKVISSQADDYITNPFGKQVIDFTDLFNFDFVFLQHGITHNDLSKWLNRYNKNIKLFVASAKPEYDALISGDYGYDSTTIKLTGLPRYDYLKNNRAGKLIIAPTWRQSLAGLTDKSTGIRQYNPNFTSSSYFKFYQNLLNDDYLLKTLRAKSMTAEFYLHPSLSEQIKDFTGNDSVRIVDMPYDYRTTFSEGNIMVTDYSSVAFDFAYLKKPIIYAQFDKAEFYAKHPWDPGYFSYENNGFGPVVYDYRATIDEIVKTIESDCIMAPEYKARVEKFFYKFDKYNSKRVYESILNIKD